MPKPFTPGQPLERHLRDVSLRRPAVQPTVDSTDPYSRTPITPYQIACTDRLKLLTDFCSEEYNIDPEHVRLILSALMPSNYLPVWMIYETTRTPFWNHLNYSIKSIGYPPLCNLSGMRLLGKDKSFIWYTEWAGTRASNPRVFIDTHRLMDGRWKQGIGTNHAYWLITAECAKATVPAVMLKLPREGAEEELARLVRMVLTPDVHRPLPKPIEPSEALAELIHAVPRLNSELKDEEPWFSNIVMLPGGHAALYGRGPDQLVDADYQIMMQALRGSIRQQLRNILHRLYLHEATQFKAVRGHDHDNLRRMTNKELAAAAGLEPKNAIKIMNGLAADGIIDKKLTPRKRLARWQAQMGMRIVTYRLTELGRIGAQIVGQMDGRYW